MLLSEHWPDLILSSSNRGQSIRLTVILSLFVRHPFIVVGQILLGSKFLVKVKLLKYRTTVAQKQFLSNSF